MASSTTGQHYHEYLDNICTYDLLLSLLQNSFLQTVKMHFRMRLGEPHGRKGLQKHESQRNHMRKSDFRMRALKPTACEKEKIRKKNKNSRNQKIHRYHRWPATVPVLQSPPLLSSSSSSPRRPHPPPFLPLVWGWGRAAASGSGRERVAASRLGWGRAAAAAHARPRHGPCAWPPLESHWAT